MTFLSDKHNYIVEQLEKLTTALLKISTEIACVARIPPTLKGNEQNPILSISVNNIYGHEAINSTCETFKDLYINNIYSQKNSRRTVGLIHIPLRNPTLSNQIALYIENINQAKQQFEDYVINHFPDRKSRFEAIHDSCPGIMTLHLYRSIKLFNNANIESLRFTWLKKDVVKKINKKQLIAVVEKEFQTHNENYQIPLKIILDGIENTPENKIRLRRQIKIQPVANIVSEHFKGPINAPMPIIVMQNEPVKFKMIANYDSTSERKVRTDRLNTKIIGTFGGFTIESIV